MVDQARKVAKRTVISHSGNTRLQITPMLIPNSIHGSDRSAISKSIKFLPPNWGQLVHKLDITFATDPPVTMKAEKLEAVLRSRPATILRIGMKSPPPPIPPAQDMAAAMKQRTAARTTGVDNCSCVSSSRVWSLLH